MTYLSGVNSYQVNQWQSANSQKGKTESKESGSASENGQLMQAFMATMGINNQGGNAGNTNVATTAASSGQNAKSGPPAGVSGPPPEILAQLQQYGLKPTGSLEGDLAAIEEAKQTQQNQQTEQKGKPQGNKGDKKPPPPPPGGKQYDANLKAALNGLGITESDDKTNDYSKAMNHFAQLTDNAANDISQKQYISSLKQAFISVYNAAS